MCPLVFHHPVMLDEVVKYILGDKNGFYVDCTFGGGGHSRAILSRLGPGGSLLGLDVDEESVVIGEQLSKEDDRFSICKENFEKLGFILRNQKRGKVDGIVIDLGTSMMQLKNKNRGFSYQEDDTFLDMRMNLDLKHTASDLLNSSTKSELKEIFKFGGDISFGGKLADAICRERKYRNIETAGDLKSVLRKFSYMEEDFLKLMRKTFQALRIAVNSELIVLEKLLDSMNEILSKNGVFCLITFHSLEEKVFFRWKRKFCDEIYIHDFSKNVANKFTLISKTGIVPSSLEVERNRSSRSATLWVVRKN